MELVFRHVRVFKNFFYGGNAIFEERKAKFLKFCSSDGKIEILRVSKRVNFNSSLG